MGRIFSRVCSAYGWSQEYLLDVLSIEQVFMYFDYVVDIEYERAYMRAAAVVGKLEPRKKPDEAKKNDGPDKKAFHEAYGDKVKRPDGEGGPIVVTG